MRSVRSKSAVPRLTVSGRGASIAVVASGYHAEITDRLIRGAAEAHAALGGERGCLEVFPAPGAFELVALSLAAASSGRFDGVVAIGCIVKGETRHDRYIAQAVVSGLAEVTLRTGVPVALGVLTVENLAQARERAGGGHGNKGAEAMEAVLRTIETAAAIRSSGRGNGADDNGRAGRGGARRGIRARAGRGSR